MKTCTITWQTKRANRQAGGSRGNEKVGLLTLKTCNKPSQTKRADELEETLIEAFRVAEIRFTRFDKDGAGELMFQEVNTPPPPPPPSPAPAPSHCPSPSPAARLPLVPGKARHSTGGLLRRAAAHGHLAQV